MQHRVTLTEFDRGLVPFGRSAIEVVEHRLVVLDQLGELRARAYPGDPVRVLVSGSLLKNDEPEPLQLGEAIRQRREREG